MEETNNRDGQAPTDSTVDNSAWDKFRRGPWKPTASASTDSNRFGEEGILVIAAIKGCLDSQLLGILTDRNCFKSEWVSMTHAVMVSWDVDKQLIMLPAVIPLGLASGSIGKDMTSVISTSDLMLCSYVALREDSPHKLVQEFIKYWKGVEEESKVEEEVAGEEVVST